MKRRLRGLRKASSATGGCTRNGSDYDQIILDMNTNEVFTVHQWTSDSYDTGDSLLSIVNTRRHLTAREIREAVESELRRFEQYSKLTG